MTPATSFRQRRLLVRGKRFLQWVFPGLVEEGLEDEVLRRRVFVSILSFIAAPMMIFFARLEYVGGSWFMVPLLLSCSAVLVLVFVLPPRR